ncbi:MAG: YbbR-like domain-containing protein [Prolixibacteraceae bacterium]
MNKKLQEIIDLFRLERLKNDRRIVIFMICLTIATVLWFLNALSKNYTTTISYSVKYTNPPENLFLSNDPPGRLNLEVEAHGFTLLRHKMSFSVSPIVLNLSNITDADENQATVSVQTGNLIRRISEQVSNEIAVINVEPEILTFSFDSLHSKTVPVVADVNLQLKPQFFLSNNISIIPDRVELTGPASIIKSIDSLKTNALSFEGLDNPVDRMVELDHPKKTKVNPNKVNLKIPVERFTEKEIKIPLSVKNKPEDLNIKIFPSDVQVSFLVGLSDYDNISASDFEIYVAYDSEHNRETLEVIVEEKPDYIRQLMVSPQNVEFLVESEK